MTFDPLTKDGVKGHTAIICTEEEVLGADAAVAVYERLTIPHSLWLTVLPHSL